MYALGSWALSHRTPFLVLRYQETPPNRGYTLFSCRGKALDLIGEFFRVTQKSRDLYETRLNNCHRLPFSLYYFLLLSTLISKGDLGIYSTYNCGRSNLVVTGVLVLKIVCSFTRESYLIVLKFDLVVPRNSVLIHFMVKWTLFK